MKQLTLIGILLGLVTSALPSLGQTDTLWTWNYGGLEGASDRIRASVQLSDGSIVTTGDIDANIAGNSGDGFLMKHSSEGEPLWQVIYTKEGHQTLSDLAIASDGGFILVGNDTESNEDGWVIRTDATGDTLWTRHFHYGQMQVINKVIETEHAEGFLLGGTSRMGSNNPSMWAIRIDGNGDEIWRNTYRTGDIDSWCNGLAEVDEGNFILAGSAADMGGTNSRLYLVKVDADGDTIWTRQYLDANILSSWVQSFVLDSDQNFVIGMSYVPTTMMPRTGMRLVRTNPDGDILLDRKYYHNIFDNYCNEAIPTSDGGYLLAGHTVNPESMELLRDVFIVRADAAGDTVGTRVYGKVDYEEVALTALEAEDGNLILGGHTQFGIAGQMDFLLMKVHDPAAPLLTISSDTLDFGLITTTGGNGQLALTLHNEGGSAITVESMTVESPFSALFELPATLQPGAHLFGAVRFEPDASGEFVDSLKIQLGSGNILHVVLLGQALFSSASEDAAPMPDTFTLAKPYPNPFNSETILPVTLPSDRNAVLSIYDINGRQVAQWNLDGHSGTILHHWQPFSNSAGIYFARLDVEGRTVATRKLLYVK